MNVCKKKNNNTYVSFNISVKKINFLLFNNKTFITTKMIKFYARDPK